MNRYQTKKRGFTLTELAIVLGIAGVIIGAIWGAAGGVSSSQKIETTNGQFLAITQGIRSLYSTSASTEPVTGAADGASLTTNLCSANIFPSNMLLPTTTVPAPACGGGLTDLWGGAVTVVTASVSTAKTGDAFAIQMTNLDQKGCIGILTGQGSQSRDSGLIFLTAGKTTPVYAAGTAQPLAFPITPATAAGVCTGGTTYTVLAVFSLKG